MHIATHHAITVTDELDALSVQWEGVRIVGVGGVEEELHRRFREFQANSLQQIDVIANDLVVVEVLQGMMI
jgi:hypothetical protein